MSADTEPGAQAGSSLSAAISNTTVRLMREYTGRGPTKAKTTIRDNVILVMLEQTLTKGEQVLVANGRGETVLTLRHEYQEAVREELSLEVSKLTGRRVLAMMSANHIDPDLGAEVFVLGEVLNADERGPDASGSATPDEPLGLGS
jgi:uncharacterized protein YbcI